MRDFMPRDGCNFGTELLYWGKRIKILQMRSLDDILSAKRGAAPMMRDYYKKMPGDRKDGWKLRNVPLFFTVVPFIMRTRLDSQNYYEETLYVEPMMDFLKAHKEDMPNISMMTIFVAAMVRMISQRPALNRFVVHNKLYAHNSITISIAIKRTMSDDGEETMIKPSFDPRDTLQDVQRRLDEAIAEAINHEEGTGIDGVAGLLERRTCVLDEKLKTALDIELLKRTPSSFLGSCRYKLPDWHEDETVYKKLFAILEKLNIGYFFYIGGNDSMDTIGKLADYGQRVGSDIRFMGVPKTIDNDLMVTDHTPGYGSAAKYIGVVMKEIIRDATVYGTKYVTVVEIMGRNAGWLTAAAALAKSDDCEGVDMICLPEVPFNVERFVEKVRVMQEKKPSIVIAVSEGVKLEDGRYVCELADDVHAVDAFGHKALTGTARYLANVVARNLDTKTRCIELSTLQRCAGHLTSRTDITEAYQVGGAAAKAAFEGVTGQMVALKRISNNPYQCTTELHPISEVANLEKKVPLSWMNNNHTQMTEDFLDYARPLIQAELTPLYIAGLPHHIYMKNQK